MIFIVIDKNTKNIGIFDCSDKFLQRGENKVQEAVAAHDLFFNNPDFNPDNYFINKTL